MFLFLPLASYSLTYDPGDLINAVKRSQVITELYMKRWKVVENSLDFKELEILDLSERFYYINRGSFTRHMDLFFRGENITGYPVKTPYGNYDLTLFRLFGSTILRFENILETEFFQWGFALSAAGFRYGMYKKIKMISNSDIVSEVDSENFQVKDYLYTQVFDDLIVFTNLFRPFGYVHLGLLLNEQVDPGPNGIIGDTDDKNISSKARIFMNSDILNFFFVNIGYNSAEDQTEFATTKLELFSLMKLPGWIERRALWPDLFLGYTYVNVSYSSTTEFIEKRQHTLFLELLYSYYNAFYFRGKSELFLWGRTPQEEENAWRQIYGELGMRLDTFTILSNPQAYYGSGSSYMFFSYYLIFGLSYLTDSRSMEFGNPDPEMVGFSLGFKMTLATLAAGGALEFRLSRNYSEKLYNLLEAYDHWIYELSLQIGF